MFADAEVNTDLQRFRFRAKRFEAYEKFIFPDLLQFYDFVLYFATKDAYQAIVDAHRKYLPTNDQRRRIRIILLKAWFKVSADQCDSLNSQNKMSLGSTRPFMGICFSPIVTLI